MSKPNKMAQAHWEFVEGLMRTIIDEEDNSLFPTLQYLYKTAFVHGYKHGYKHGKVDGGCECGGQCQTKTFEPAKFPPGHYIKK